MRKLITLIVLLFSIASNAQQADTTLTDEKKIYGLSLFWQEANYNYAYFDNVPNLNWDSAYRAFIPQVLATTNNFQYYRVLQRFCALLQDGHTNVFLPDYLAQKRVRRSFGDIKLELKNFNGRPIVVNNATLTKEIIPVGSEITAVNQIPVQQYMQQYVRPYISQSAAYITDDWCADYLLESFVGDSLLVEFIKPDKTKTSKWLKAEVKQNVTWNKPYSTTLFQVHTLENGILKLDINSFNDTKIVDTFITALPLIAQAKAVIIDLRENGGGNSGNSAAILSYFTDSAFIKGSAWSTREHRAAFKAWGAFAKQNQRDTSEWANKNRNYYDGKVWFDGGRTMLWNKVPLDKRFTKIPLVVLLGHKTASAAEDFLIMLDGLPGRATTIGEPSFASTGQPLSFFLPGGGSARICTKRDTYPDGRIFVGKGIQPDIKIAQTIEDYMKNKDVVLEKAIEVLKKN